MKFRVEVICLQEDGTEDRCDVIDFERHELAMETLGLDLKESKAILHGVQVAEDLDRRRKCPGCGQFFYPDGHRRSIECSANHCAGRRGPVVRADSCIRRANCPSAGRWSWRRIFALFGVPFQDG